MIVRSIRLLSTLLVFWLTGAISAQAQGRYIAFGDSLTDPGNLFAATGTPPAPYYQGHFSNGLTWFEQIAGTPKNFFTFSASSTGNVDFAFGGARTDANILSGATTLPYGLQSQIAAYLAKGGTFSANDTVTLWAGANNLFNAFDASIPGYTTPTATSLAAVMTSAAADMKTAVNTLVANGARKILILNLPDVGNTPSYLPTAGKAGATYASQTFNTQLAAQMAAIKAVNPNVSITQVDVYSVFSLVSANPSAFGFADASSNCTTTPACVTASKAVQNTYAFWDGVHPTEAGHALIAQIALQYLNTEANSAGLAYLADHALSTRSAAAGRVLSRFDDLRRGSRTEEAPYIELIGGHISGNYSQSSIGLAVGLHHRVSPDSSLIFEGFVQGGNWRAGLFESDSVDGGLAAAYQFTQDKYFLRGTIGTGFSYFGNVERKTVALLKNNFDQTSITGHAIVEAGLAYPVGSFTLSPRARLGWLAANFDSVTETGIVAPLQLSAHTASTFTGGAELQASTDVAIDESRKIGVTGTLGFERWFGVSNYSVDAMLANNTALPFKIGSSNPTGPGVILGLGMSGKVSETASVTLAYRASIGQHATRQDLRAGLQMPF